MAAKPASIVRLTVRLPKYRRNGENPICEYCGRVLLVKELNVGVYWEKWWHNNLHWGCAQSFAGAVLNGEDVKLNGKNGN